MTTSPETTPETQGGSARPASRGPAGRTTLWAAVVVALTAGFLALAGTTPRGVGAPVQTFKRVQLDQRTFSCAGGIPGSKAIHGDVPGGVAPPADIGDQPVVVDVHDGNALEAFAGQEARKAHWLAWSACPEPRPRWWFVGAGAATVSHDTVLTLTNPRVGQADVDIDVYGPNGPVAAPGLHGVTVAAGGTRVIDLAKAAPSVGDLAVNVVATRGLVAVSAADRFAPGVVGKAAQEWLPGQWLPAPSVTLAGLPPKPDQATLVVANPGQDAAVVSVEVIGTGGTFAPKDIDTLTVPPGSVATASLRSVFNGEPLAIRVKAPHPVAATVRTVTGGDVAFASAVRPIEGTTALAVPEGSGQLVLSSTGKKGKVSVTAFSGAGKALLDKAVAVPGASSVATALPPGTAYLRLVASGSDAVAGFFVSDPAGMATGGVVPAIRSVLQPVVRPGW